MDVQDIRERLRSVPRSYEDFVSYTVARVEENDSLKDAVMNLIEINPEANSSDILELIADYLGLGEPLDVVDEENDVRFAVSGVRAAY